MGTAAVATVGEETAATPAPAGAPMAETAETVAAMTVARGVKESLAVVTVARGAEGSLAAGVATEARWAGREEGECSCPAS